MGAGHGSLHAQPAAMNLTARQQSVLTALRRHGSYPSNWYVDSPEYTEHVLNRLADSGQVECVDGVYTLKEK